MGKILNIPYFDFPLCEHFEIKYKNCSLSRKIWWPVIIKQNYRLPVYKLYIINCLISIWYQRIHISLDLLVTLA